MAKHKKPTPAAKKPAAKPVKATKKSTSTVPAKKPESHSSKPVDKKAKPAPAKAAPAKAEPAPAPKAKVAAAPAKPVEKAPEKKPTGKTSPPVEVKPAAKPAAPTKTVASGKSNPPIPTKAAAPAPAAKPAKPLSEKAQAKADAREALRSRILGARRASKPIALTLEEVREIAKTAQPVAAVDEAAKPVKAGAKGAAKPDLSKIEKPATPNHVKAASLADILGFNPKKTQKPAQAMVDPEDVPEKFRRYYRLLLDLRSHILEGLNLHTEETLKRSAKDDAGDLSSYGQHMADAGTDTFDRDFALSLVSSEQEALTEIEAAIKRVHDGTYGICEVTGKPIAKERLLAVPFTRYSAEAQKEIEKNRMRTRSAPGLFGEIGEEGGRMSEDDGGGDE